MGESILIFFKPTESTDRRGTRIREIDSDAGIPDGTGVRCCEFLKEYGGDYPLRIFRTSSLSTSVMKGIPLISATSLVREAISSRPI